MSGHTWSGATCYDHVDVTWHDRHVVWRVTHGMGYMDRVETHGHEREKEGR